MRIEDLIYFPINKLASCSKFFEYWQIYVCDDISEFSTNCSNHYIGILVELVYHNSHTIIYHNIHSYYNSQINIARPNENEASLCFSINFNANARDSGGPKMWSKFSQAVFTISRCERCLVGVLQAKIHCLHFGIKKIKMGSIFPNHTYS